MPAARAPAPVFIDDHMPNLPGGEPLVLDERATDCETGAGSVFDRDNHDALA